MTYKTAIKDLMLKKQKKPVLIEDISYSDDELVRALLPNMEQNERS